MEQEILKKVKESIKNIEPSAEIFLFGSHARRNHTQESDWDFLILVNGAVDTARTDRIRHHLYEIELETGQIISSIIRSRQDWNSPRYGSIPLHANIKREGILI